MSKTLPTIAVLASGQGSNFQALIDAAQSGTISARIALLITNNPHAYALERAQRAGITTAIVPDTTDRIAYGEQLLATLHTHRIDLVCLAGFMRVIAANVVQAFRGRMLNIHPSLLPAFPGLHAIRQALAAEVTETGVTVHLVDEGVDTGPIVLQEVVSIIPDDTEASLTARIHIVEHRLYPQAVQMILRTL